MHHNDTTILFAGKYGNLNKFCKFQLGLGVNAIKKKVGMYLQNDSYLISNSSYTIKLASKLKLIYSTFGILGQVWYLIVSIPDLCTLTYFHTMEWFDMQTYFLICIFINIDESFRK